MIARVLTNSWIIQKKTEFTKDKFIEDLVEIYRELSGVHVVDGSEADDNDSVELPIVNCSDAANSLEVVRSFLQQQEDY